MPDYIEVHPDELELVTKQLAANPPDGNVRLEQAAKDSLVATWLSDGRATRVGPADTRPLPS